MVIKIYIRKSISKPSKQYSRRETTLFTVEFMFFLLGGIFLFIFLMFENAPNITKDAILFYGKPEDAKMVGGLILILIPVITLVICMKSRIEHKKAVFAIIQIVFIGFGLISLHMSYYIVAENNIYYSYLNKTVACSPKEVGEIKVILDSNKGKYYTDIDVTLKNKITFKLQENIDKSNFLDFDKQCVNAKKRVSKELIENYGDIFTEYFGDTNAEYILKNYSEY